MASEPEVALSVVPGPEPDTIHIFGSAVFEDDLYVNYDEVLYPDDQEYEKFAAVLNKVISYPSFKILHP